MKNIGDAVIINVMIHIKMFLTSIYIYTQYIHFNSYLAGNSRRAMRYRIRFPPTYKYKVITYINIYCKYIFYLQ